MRGQPWKVEGANQGWLAQQRGDRPGRVLFLADRVVLRDQAHNALAPFARGSSEPRLLLEEGGRLSLNRDLYFALYPTLWREQAGGERLFEQVPRDFFDLVIIDEAHRSGFGTWREILDHFGSAIHLGMTVTPKQDENIDTYAYFSAEEAPIPVDPDNPEKGLIQQPPAYTYSLGQGIEDGFLATYKVHRIRTNVDRDWLHVQEVMEQGADFFVPEGALLRQDYDTPQFEREITLPDRTRRMVEHLAQLLRRFGPLQKSIVFCVDMAHAYLVAELLNNAFSELGHGEDYAVAIVSDEGEQGRRRLKTFQDSDKTLPVVATTAELLSTGVDAPAVRNIVFMKTLSSPILFKQIIGRGTRLDPATDKLWFRIVDYTDATRLLDPRWDHPPSSTPAAPDTGPRTATLTGIVRLAGSGELLVGASVALQVAPNEQRGPILTDGEGRYLFDNLPAGTLTLIASRPGLTRRQSQVVTRTSETTSADIELEPQREKISKIKVEGLPVPIADEATFVIEGMSEAMSLEQYLDYSRAKLGGLVPDWAKLQTLWQEPEPRRTLREQLARASIHPEVLAEVLQVPDACSTCWPSSPTSAPCNGAVNAPPPFWNGNKGGWTSKAPPCARCWTRC